MVTGLLLASLALVNFSMKWSGKGKKDASLWSLTRSSLFLQELMKKLNLGIANNFLECIHIESHASAFYLEILICSSQCRGALNVAMKSVIGPRGCSQLPSLCRPRRWKVITDQPNDKATFTTTSIFNIIKQNLSCVTLCFLLIPTCYSSNQRTNSLNNLFEKSSFAVSVWWRSYPVSVPTLTNKVVYKVPVTCQMISGTPKTTSRWPTDELVNILNCRIAYCRVPF